MLDTIISPDNYAYQFRVDLLPTASFYCKDASNVVVDLGLLQQSYMRQINIFLTNEEFVDWVVSFETSPSGKHHYQCIIWHRQNLSTKIRNSLKAKYFRTNRDSTNAISFTSAKKVINLSSYVFKDNQEYQDHIQENYIDQTFSSTLSYEQVSLIPKWLTKEKMKAKWKSQVEEQILLIVSEDVYGHRPTKLQTAKEIIKFYRKHDNPPPNKNMLFKMLLRYLPSYTETDYLVDIGFHNPY